MSDQIALVKQDALRGECQRAVQFITHDDGTTDVTMFEEARSGAGFGPESDCEEMYTARVSTKGLRIALGWNADSTPGKNLDESRTSDDA